MNNSTRNFFTMKRGSTSSTHRRRGRTTANGRKHHELLNTHFFTWQTKEDAHGRLDIFAWLFFTFSTFKSKRVSGLFGLLNFKNRNRCMSALVRVDA